MSTTYKTSRRAASLLIGGFGAAPVYFGGNESLATIAAPGTGRTAAQVVPNLLTYPGSCFKLKSIADSGSIPTKLVMIDDIKPVYAGLNPTLPAAGEFLKA